MRDREGHVLFDALSDPTRYSIVNMLLTRDLTADEITKRTGKARSTIERHLENLMEAGLVTRRRSGERAYIYSATKLARDVMQALRGQLREVDSNRGDLVVEIPIKRATMRGHYLLISVLALSLAYVAISLLAVHVPIWLLGAVLGLLTAPEANFRKVAALLLLSALLVSAISSLSIGGSPSSILLTSIVSLIGIFLPGVICWYVGRTVGRLT